MVFDFPSPSSWNRAFSVWIQGIHVGFQPVVAWERRWMRGGFLRRVRGVARQGAVWVAAFFCLHCTRPQALPLSASDRPLPRPGFATAAFEEVGEASWYGSEEDGFAGRLMASGVSHDPERLICAHRTLPLGSHVEVENLATGQCVVLQVHDRGPFVRGRILDVSRRAARELGFLEQGTARVRLRTVNPQGGLASTNLADPVGPYIVQAASSIEEGQAQGWVQVLKERLEGGGLQAADRSGVPQVRRAPVAAHPDFGDARKVADTIERILKDRGVEPFILRRR